MGDMQSDAELLAEWTARRSEAAFARLVERYVALVHSAARRQVSDPHLAEEITQAVFILLARKAGSLSRQTVLAGWLCRTAHYAARDALKAERRRQHREQLAATMDPPTDAAWQQLAPLLDEAVAQLREADRNAIVLRYYEKHSLDEVGTALGIGADAAQKRVARALEKLRGIFAKRGVTLTGAAIAGAVSANAVQAVPVGLTATVASTTTNGAVIGSSVLTLVKGVLKVMAWTKAKTAIIVSATVLTAGTTTVVVTNTVKGSADAHTQRLEDGSLLVLSRVSFSGRSEFTHGSMLQKLLGNTIPANGVQMFKFKLARATRQTFESPKGKSQLVAEFKVADGNAANHPLVKPAFYREFRCVIRGEGGIEYVYEFWPGQFRQYSDGFFGYVVASRFPRDSRWLWLRVERRASQTQGGPWKSVAEFKIGNAAGPTNEPWVADPAPVIKTLGGIDFALDEITVATQPYAPRDIWNHIVTAPFQVSSNSTVLTNWGAAYVRVEDASGNWDYNLASHRSLDPRFVWRLDADFEPASDYPVGTTTTVELPAPSTRFTTNVLGVPVTIFWDGSWVDVNMPTNRQDLALRFVCVENEEGEKASEGSGSWGQYSFWKGDFMWHKGGVLRIGLKPTKMTFAIVPNIRATFFAQPRLVTAQGRDSLLSPP